jgi:NDP-sugar pyrophosphorylase family protein
MSLSGVRLISPCLPRTIAAAMRRALNIADIPAALLAGGLATRLRPITETIPKALVEVAGRPFVDHQLELLRRHGVRRVVLCLGHLGDRVRDHLGDGSRLGMDLQYAFDGEKLLGTGGALLRAANLLGQSPADPFWVMYGDSYMDIDYPAVLDSFDRCGADGLMTVLHNGNRWDKSNVVFRDGKLIRYDKKHATPEMDYIDYGVALLRHRVLERVPVGQPFDLAALYSELVEEGKMAGYEVTNRFYEIGTPAALEEARRYLAGRAI